MTATIYQFPDLTSESDRDKLVPLIKLDALPLEERLPALQRHIDALDERIALAYKKNKAQLRKLRKAQARFKRVIREHQAAQAHS